MDVEEADGEDVKVTADTGAASLPVTVALCQTNPVTGACLSAPASIVTTAIPNGATPTFAFFVTAAGSVAFDPAVNRVFVP